MQKKGFTLVELAIVIVIIGLLVGGVLAGQELVQQAKIRTAIKQITSYEAAILIFKDKYKCLPGDCRTASTLIAPTATNGDGDGNIYPNLVATSEMLYTWQHLGLVKLIKGSYTGVADATKLNIDIGVNIPKIDGFDGGMWIFFRDGTIPMGGVSAYTNFGKANQHVIVLGGAYTAGGNYRLYGGFADGVAAQQMDTKLDDGLPSSGSLNTGNSNLGSECTNPANINSAWNGQIPTTYNLTSSKADCIIFRWLNI